MKSTVYDGEKSNPFIKVSSTNSRADINIALDKVNSGLLVLNGFSTHAPSHREKSRTGRK